MPAPVEDQQKKYRGNVEKLLEMVKEQTSKLQVIENRFKGEFNDIRDNLKRIKVQQKKVVKEQQQEEKVEQNPESRQLQPLNFASEIVKEVSEEKKGEISQPQDQSDVLDRQRSVQSEVPVKLSKPATKVEDSKSQDNLDTQNIPNQHRTKIVTPSNKREGNSTDREPQYNDNQGSDDEKKQAKFKNINIHNQYNNIIHIDN